ncbi:MAG TPA: CpsB/CapC family capsule biosynthesis tyrosine phosphatase [Gemmatimonadales bacterium]|nr:CpsB/CapC family capsule biosynthesis tyrosine phosphatase [Gemmatimonadales bacterium]
MIDLHSHLLPGVDDGSRSVRQSVAVLRDLAAAGITDLCLTPHFNASAAERGLPQAHHRAFDELLAAAPEAPRLHRGAEVMLDRPLTPAAADRAVAAGVTLGGSHFMLVEFPRLVPRDTVHTALKQVAGLGLTPLLAHPERYSSCSPMVVRHWRETGALMQVDANTLLQPSERGDRARALVSAGLADVLAADNHGDDRTLHAAYQFLVAAGGDVAAELLTVTNPRAILDDGAAQAVPAVPLTAPFAWRLRRMLGGSGT